MIYIGVSQAAGFVVEVWCAAQLVDTEKMLVLVGLYYSCRSHKQDGSVNTGARCVGAMFVKLWLS